MKVGEIKIVFLAAHKTKHAILDIAVIQNSIMSKVKSEISKISPVRGILRRSSSGRRNSVVQPCSQTEICNSDKGVTTKKPAKSTKTGRKVRILEKDNDPFQDTYTCEYCMVNDSFSVIQCENCVKNGVDQVVPNYQSIFMP